MKFQIRKADILPPIALEYLQMALDRTPGTVETVESVLDAINAGAGAVFLISMESELYGALFTQLIPNPNKDRIRPYFFNIIALGGKKMELWEGEVWEFLVEMADALEAQIISITGRRWQGVWPKARQVGYIYVYP